MNLVKLAEATAWPIATIVVAVAVLLITRMIITKSGNVGLKIKDWISFEANASEQIAQTIAMPAVDLSIPLAENLTPAGQTVTEAGAPPAAMTETPQNLEDQDASGNNALSRMFDAKDLRELEYAFEAFKTSIGEDLDLDFWMTFYVERKQALGVSETEEELLTLSEANPTWSNPLLSLLRTAVSTHDLDAATKIIKQVLARRNKNSSACILQSVICALYALVSDEQALQFYKEMVQQGATSSERSAMLAGIATSLDKASQAFAYRVATEMTLLVDPARRDNHFQLAYSYGEEEKNWTLAFYHYQLVENVSGQYTWAINNLGVLLSGLDNAASNDHYYRGMLANNALSTSNLARRLINDGYYALGEQLLDSIGDVQDAAEHIASSRASALSGRRAMTKRLDEIAAFSRNEAQRHSAIVARAMRSIGRGDPAPRGVFGTEDRSFMVLFDSVGAGCRVSVGTLSYEGVLPSCLFGHSGTLAVKGQSLFGSSMSVSLFVTGRDEITAVIWPNSRSTNDRIHIAELRLLESPPNPALEAPHVSSGDSKPNSVTFG